MRWPWQKKELESVEAPMENPVRRLCIAFLLAALQRGATRMSFRLDGEKVWVCFETPQGTEDYVEIPTNRFARVINVYKVMANIAVTRPPRVGRILLNDARGEAIGGFELSTFDEGGTESAEISIYNPTQLLNDEVPYR